MRMIMAQYRAYVRRTSGAGQIKRHATRTKAEETVLRALEAASDGGREYRIAQQVRNLFPLPGGGEYIPDFVLLYPDGGMTVVEVKGGYKGPGAEQGHERYARVASLYATKVCRFEKWTVGRNGQINGEAWL